MTYNEDTLNARLEIDAWSECKRYRQLAVDLYSSKDHEFLLDLADMWNDIAMTMAIGF